MSTPLEYTRHKVLSDYNRHVAGAPPLSKALLSHLKITFYPPDVDPGDLNISEKLLFQHGIQRVLKYMETLHDRQEKEIQTERARE